jgi:hypothetical protein
MRTPQRRLDAGLIADSRQSPERYEFFQLVRLYELAFRGEGGDAVSERIRFRNSLRLGFAPSQVDGIEASHAAGEGDTRLERVEITPAFMGMLGVHGALPTHYTEQVIHRERHLKDTAGRAFLDLFPTARWGISTGPGRNTGCPSNMRWTGAIASCLCCCPSPGWAWPACAGAWAPSTTNPSPASPACCASGHVGRSPAAGARQLLP